MIQSHLKKLFAGIHSVGFDADRKAVVEMRSQVPLDFPKLFFMQLRLSAL